MNWLRTFADRIERDVPLSPMTWFRLGGRARLLFRPSSARQLGTFLGYAAGDGLPVRVLGAGANVLVSDDGFDGVVVRLSDESFKRVRARGDGRFEVGAGVDLMPFSRRISQDGWAGLERMAGIPATVGGALCMNAGGRFGEFGAVVLEATVMAPDGHMETRTARQLGFRYRSSSISDSDIVIDATIGLRREKPTDVSNRYAECFHIKEQSQPLSSNSAGCIFKNPTGEPAGALIDRLGLKGTRCGGAAVSDRHANFIVTDRSATASHVILLIETVRSLVRERSGTTLETEIDIW